jgi:hypothetical protein
MARCDVVWPHRLGEYTEAELGSYKTLKLRHFVVVLSPSSQHQHWFAIGE